MSDTAQPATAQRRRDLVQAAFDVIAERGFEGLRTREVAARVGVNVATLHYYLPTKGDLVAAVASHLADQYRDTHAPPVPETSPALRRLRQELADARYYRAERPDLMRVFRELALRAERDPAVRDVLDPLYAAWTGELEDMLKAGIEEGSFRTDLDPEAGAAALVAFLWGGGALPRLDGPAFAAACDQVERWLRPPSQPQTE